MTYKCCHYENPDTGEEYHTLTTAPTCPSPEAGFVLVESSDVSSQSECFPADKLRDIERPFLATIPFPPLPPEMWRYLRPLGQVLGAIGDAYEAETQKQLAARKAKTGKSAKGGKRTRGS